MKQNLLLVDDDLDEFIILSEALEETGASMKCRFGQTIEAALAEIDKTLPYAVLVDMNMPRTNGLECIERLVSRLGTNKVPVFIYTTSLNSHLCSKAIKSGARGCIQKPKDISTLTTVLKDLFSKLINPAPLWQTLNYF